ncbi:MAG: hypothetical protein ABR550_11030, partial [Wenzhouxiangellaceae bacterium]
LLRGKKREIRGQLESLHVLNRERDDKGRVQSWLAENQLDQAPSLLQSLIVDPEWQAAVETVLEHWLSARMIEGDSPSEVPRLGIGLVRADAGAARPGSLAEKVEGAGGLARILATVYCCASVAEALERRDSLEANQSLITPDGLW